MSAKSRALSAQKCVEERYLLELVQREQVLSLNDLCMLTFSGPEWVREHIRAWIQQGYIEEIVPVGMTGRVIPEDRIFYRCKEADDGKYGWQQGLAERRTPVRYREAYELV